MRKWNVYIFFMCLSIQNLFSQQDNMVILVFKNVPKHFINMPCQNMEDCAKKAKYSYLEQDTLYIVYDVATLKIRNISMIEGYTNKRHHYKISLITPVKNKQKNFNHIAIQWGNITYLFKKKKSFFIFQHKKVDVSYP